MDILCEALQMIKASVYVGSNCAHCTYVTIVCCFDGGGLLGGFPPSRSHIAEFAGSQVSKSKRLE